MKEIKNDQEAFEFLDEWEREVRIAGKPFLDKHGHNSDEIAQELLQILLCREIMK